MKYLLAVAISSFVSGIALADVSDSDFWAEKQVLILKSSQNYNEALKAANEASSSLRIKTDLRGLSANRKIGLTFSENECKESGFDFPCYIARGRYDDGTYISIEYSSAFENFKPGFYIVVAAMSFRNDQEIASALKQARKSYPDAYVKNTKVYMGCMH